MHSLETLPALDAFPATLFTIERWDTMLKQIPKKSARGADSFPPYELKMLPPSLKQWLFQLFHTTFRAVMLSKGEQTVDFTYGLPA